MNQRDDLDRMLGTWLDDPLTLPTPGYLGEVLDQTRQVRQRPSWASLERWLPMTITLRYPFVAPATRFAAVGLALALIGVALAGAMPLVQRAVQPPVAGPTSSGELITFSSPEGDIFVVGPEPGSEPRLIVGGPQVDEAPVWSPDGRHLAFFRVTDSGETPMVTDAEGTEPLALVDRPTTATRWIEWMPDSTSLVIATRDPVLAGPDNDEIVILAVDGSGVRSRRQTSIFRRDPVSAVTGRPGGNAEPVILYRTDDQVGELSYSRSDNSKGPVLRADDVAGTPNTNATGWGEFLAPTWAPSGDRIAYYHLNAIDDAPDGVGFRVHVARFDATPDLGHDDRLVEFDPMADAESWPVWSPDGTKLAFQTFEDGRSRLVIVNVPPEGPIDAATAVTTRGLSTTNAEGLTYAWAPDSRSIVLANTGAPVPPDAAAYLVDVATGELDALAWSTPYWPSWRQVND